MGANDHYTKILLSKSELAHVYRQVFYASQEKFKKLLPGCAPHDEFLMQVQNMMSANLETTFEKAKYALIVDGEDLADNDVHLNKLLTIEEREEVVPFDTELNQQLRDLIKQVENETTEVTQLRRELPQEARAAYEKLVLSIDQQVTDFIKEITENAETDENFGSLDSGMKELMSAMESSQVPIQNSDTIRARILESLQNLYSLKKELPQLRSELQSCDDTTAFMMNVYEKLKVERRLFE
ncbi:hypothetical protein METBIDRAFT_31048 [Metschnikowia bicuspidata var. bicuspidata NRRL YB-4993]|uniref:Uncharacterized protein n=1 Tax=Metschnikowia bicuspidata var. bicuspidata NRRL YB-4993 TaxID=869754 RepID=A0A1A0HDN6_9ASCO|nr:hypothetical protein METBIDRAFT_31048 [Metschnikowia bicuspidata var. bicuspidata NRRL YB-4993]OBA22090.1 hypothetical protein METBIDRAFT_31048 [Metschnikowia bicuspidata var. bicuspidata NRRL YB-4993]